jgi:hypothetical protein
MTDNPILGIADPQPNPTGKYEALKVVQTNNRRAGSMLGDHITRLYGVISCVACAPLVSRAIGWHIRRAAPTQDSRSVRPSKLNTVSLASTSVACFLVERLGTRPAGTLDARLRPFIRNSG